MRVGMFLGVETYNWTPQQIVNVCYQLKNIGVDTVFLKVSDGKFTWYGDTQQMISVVQEVAKVIKVIPYQYVYGNTYGGMDSEIAISNAIIHAGFTPCLDMEVEWNSHPDWCQYLVQHLNGQVHVSTWADPALQDWTENLRVLDPKTYCFFPQVYTSYLQGVWQEQYEAAGIRLDKCIPTVTPATIGVAQGRNAISIWEYLNVTRPELIELQRELVQGVTGNMNSNESQKKQAEDIWNANTVGAKSGTGIYAVYLEQFMDKNRVLGIPVSGEISTVDWSGNPIKKMFFSNGVSIEWYTVSQNGHTAGENHGYSFTTQLW